jgi:hypothetical protein
MHRWLTHTAHLSQDDRRRQTRIVGFAIWRTRATDTQSPTGWVDWIRSEQSIKEGVFCLSLDRPSNWSQPNGLPPSWPCTGNSTAAKIWTGRATRRTARVRMSWRKGTTDLSLRWNFNLEGFGLSKTVRLPPPVL